MESLDTCSGSRRTAEAGADAVAGVSLCAKPTGTIAAKAIVKMARGKNREEFSFIGKGFSLGRRLRPYSRKTDQSPSVDMQWMIAGTAKAHLSGACWSLPWVIPDGPSRGSTN